MKKIFYITLAAVLMCCTQIPGQAKGKVLEERTVVYKGESLAGLGVNYLNLNSNNSDILLTITNIDAKGSYLKVSPSYGYAVSDNHVIGARLNFSSIKGGADNLSLDLLGLMEVENANFQINTRSVGGTVFYRRYVGLDKKGNVGLYLETSLGYKSSRSTTGSDPDDAYTLGNQFKFNFAPGVILYIVPMASLHVQLGMANVSYNTSNCFKGGDKTGHLNRWKGGVGLNVMDLMFGVTYHF